MVGNSTSRNNSYCNWNIYLNTTATIFYIVITIEKCHFCKFFFKMDLHIFKI